MIASFPLVMVVPEDHPAKTVRELVAWAKSNPDKSNYGTSSPTYTIATECLKLRTRRPPICRSSSWRRLQSAARSPTLRLNQLPLRKPLLLLVEVGAALNALGGNFCVGGVFRRTGRRKWRFGR